jgi:acetylornithine deacetylase
LKQGQTAAGASEIELLGRLTGFNTVSSRSNLEMIEFIKSYLAALGVESVVLPDETGKKASLVATIGPADKAGYVLSGHTDVVPVDGQDWSRDPFTMWRDGGRLYGRGVSDMKEGLSRLRAGMRPRHGEGAARRAHPSRLFL